MITINNSTNKYRNILFKNKLLGFGDHLNVFELHPFDFPTV